MDQILGDAFGCDSPLFANVLARAVWGCEPLGVSLPSPDLWQGMDRPRHPNDHLLGARSVFSICFRAT